ncbi:MAG: hypothetical protein M3Z05_10870 [Gemmatimonadota bacterium]|nr:hypothetical protein [Gemmatimonadota bacterium]
MRALVVLLLITMAGCASAPSASATPDSETMRVSGAGNLRMAALDQTTNVKVDFPVDKVWHALPAAFESLGIPITSVDDATHTIANGGLKLRRELGKVSLSRYIDCGTTQIGENADSYDVYLTITSQVQEEPTSGLSVLRTTFEAMARPIAFSRDYARCSSKGELEKRLATAVKSQLQ